MFEKENDKNSQFLTHQHPLGGLNDLEFDWIKDIFIYISLKIAVETLVDSLLSVILQFK